MSIVGVLAAAAVGLVLFAGCDPQPVPDAPDKAEVNLDVRADRTVHVELLLPTRFTRRDLERIGNEATAALFGTRPNVHTSIEPNGGGYPFPVVDVSDAYQPGTHPVFTVDTAALQSVLRTEMVPKISLTVCGPRVPLTVAATPPPDTRDSSCVQWFEVGSPPRVEVTMRPVVSRWWAEVALVGLALVADLFAFGELMRNEVLTARRRLLAALLAGAGLVASAIGIASGAAVQGDNLGVRGALSGAALRVATWGLIVVLPGSLASLTLLVAVLTARPRSGSNVATGPPPAPAGQDSSPTSRQPSPS